MREKQKQEIATFRYGLIAPVVNETIKHQNSYFRELANKPHQVPHIGEKYFKKGTFKAWLRGFRQHGFDGLYPKSRSDRGKTKKITSYHHEIIKRHLAENDFYSFSHLYRQLLVLRDIKEGEFTYQTLKKYIKENDMLEVIETISKQRKKFEHAHINELWICDFMHCLYIKDGKQKRKTYLCAIIDDYSRVIVGSGIYFNEGSFEVANTLKNAILTYGVPRRFYCDNGAGFISQHLYQICARLEIALIHSKPYDPQSRGKIERFMRTIRQLFLPNLKEDMDLDQFNQKFNIWLKEEYHKRLHSGINEEPLTRYMNDISNVVIKRYTKEELSAIFYATIKRQVKNDSTISIDKGLYEVPSQYIGQTIEIRYQEKGQYYLFIKNKQVCKLNKVNVHENAKSINFTEIMEDKNV